MNSYIKLKNGIIINLSQIELIGPLMPFNLTADGQFAGEDEADFYAGQFDLGIVLGNNTNNGIEDLKTKVFLVPSDSPVNDIYKNKKPEGYEYVPQPYMILLKSGRIILLTKGEYQNIIDVMGFEDNNYTNVDQKYMAFN